MNLGWLTRRADRLLCGGTGVFCIGQAYLQPAAQQELAISSLVVGGLLVFGAATLHRVRAVALPGGAKLELDPEAEASVAIASRDEEKVKALPAPVVADARLRLELASETFGDLFHPDSGPLVGCGFDLYLYDSDLEMLLAIFSSDEDRRPPRWRPGYGATGMAWVEETFVLAVGEEVWGDRFGLTDEEQADNRHLAVVGALPVVDARGDVLAILTAWSEDEDSELKTPAGLDELVSIAEAVRTVLVDVLEWFPG